MARRDMDIFAAEYVLGTLDAAERTEAERLRTADPAFEAAVDAWQTRLMPLGETVSPIEAPASLWNRIESARSARGADATAWPDEVRTRIESLQRNLAAWRAAAVGAAAAAAAIALVWFAGVDMPLRQGEPPARYMAVLQADSGDVGFVVTLDMKDKNCIIRTLLPDLPAAKAYELWALIKNGNTQPMSLGLVGTEAYAMRDMPVQLDHDMLEKGVKLAISLEAPGGAPKGRPMGPVMFAGELIRMTP